MRVKPAELTRMSARPNSSRTASATLRIWAVSSSGRCIALWPLPAKLATTALARSIPRLYPTTTRAPASANSRALAAPMPLLAPVMTATLPPRSLPICPAIPVLPASSPRRCYAAARGIVTVSVVRRHKGDDRNGIADCGGGRARGRIRPARWAVRRRGRVPGDPADGHPLRHPPADGAGNRAGNGRAERVVRVLAVPAAVWRRSADGRYDRRLGSGHDLSDRPAGDRARPARVAGCL